MSPLLGAPQLGGKPAGGGVCKAGWPYVGGGTASPVNQLMPTTNLLPSITKLPEQLNSATAATQRLKDETNAL